MQKSADSSTIEEHIGAVVPGGKTIRLLTLYKSTNSLNKSVVICPSYITFITILYPFDPCDVVTLVISFTVYQ